MNLRIVVLYSSILALSAVLAEEQTDESDTEPKQEYEQLTPEKKAEIYGDLTNENRTKRSGRWLKEDGASVCDGYLTQVEGEDYCAAEIPDDWQPFTFNGKTYYMQPLT
jgi:hypothetical protein